jgi:hypothetical protein
MLVSLFFFSCTCLVLHAPVAGGMLLLTSMLLSLGCMLLLWCWALGFFFFFANDDVVIFVTPVPDIICV